MKLAIIVTLLVIAACSAKPALEEGQGASGAGCNVPEVLFIRFALISNLETGLCRGDAVV